MADRLSALWDKTAPWIVAFLAVTTFAAVWGGVLLDKQNLSSQNNHHATTTKKDNEILDLLNTVHQTQADNQNLLIEIKDLAQVNTVICADITTVAAASMIPLAACPTLPAP